MQMYKYVLSWGMLGWHHPRHPNNSRLLKWLDSERLNLKKLSTWYSPESKRQCNECKRRKLPPHFASPDCQRKWVFFVFLSHRRRGPAPKKLHRQYFSLTNKGNIYHQWSSLLPPPPCYSVLCSLSEIKQRWWMCVLALSVSPEWNQEVVPIQFEDLFRRISIGLYPDRSMEIHFPSSSALPFSVFVCACVPIIYVNHVCNS